MIVNHGNTSKQLKKSPLPKLPCSNCEKSTTEIVIYGSYITTLGIPLFPSDKSVIIRCTDCGHIVKERGFSSEMLTTVKELKQKVKHPWYAYWIIWISIPLVAISAWFFYLSIANKELYLKEPAVDDVYLLYDEEQKSSFRYHFWKVASVAGDSLDLMYNDFYYSRPPDQLDTEDGFFKTTFRVHKGLIYELYQQKIVRNFSRHYTFFKGYDQVIHEEEIPDTSDNQP